MTSFTHSIYCFYNYTFFRLTSKLFFTGPYISLPNLVTAMSPPTLSIHGKVDVVVPNIMSVKLHEALDKYNVSNALSIMSGRGHNFDVGEYSAGGQLSWYAFERFLAAVVPIEQNR